MGIAPRARIGSSKIFDCNFEFLHQPHLQARSRRTRYVRGARISNNSWGLSAASGRVHGGCPGIRRRSCATRTRISPETKRWSRSSRRATRRDSGLRSHRRGRRRTSSRSAPRKGVRAVPGADGCDDRERSGEPRRRPPGLLVSRAYERSPSEARPGGTGQPRDRRRPPALRVHGQRSGPRVQQDVPLRQSLLLALVGHLTGGSAGGRRGRAHPRVVPARAGRSSLAGHDEGDSHEHRHRPRRQATTARAPRSRPAPNNDQGWGRVNLGSAFDSSERVYHDQLRGAANLIELTGDSWSGSFAPADADAPLEVTLVWTDPPGPTGGNASVNNLDLVVDAGGADVQGQCFRRRRIGPGWYRGFAKQRRERLPPGPWVGAL